MEKLIMTDVTVEKAIQKGLMKLNVSQNDVDVVIKDEGKRGIFGFGQKNAIVELIVKKQDVIVEEETINVPQDDINIVVNEVQDADDIVEVEEAYEDTEDSHYQSISDYLVSVAKEYGADISVSISENSKKLVFDIETEKAGLLIGKHGKIINALQVLAQTLVYQLNERAPMVVVNIGDYRQKREEKLKEVADKTAKRVLKTKQSVFLEPLPAFERKIVHARLSKYDNITTHSEGKEPHRYLIVDFEG